MKYSIQTGGHPPYGPYLRFSICFGVTFERRDSFSIHEMVGFEGMISFALEWHAHGGIWRSLTTSARSYLSATVEQGLRESIQAFLRGEFSDQHLAPHSGPSADPETLWLDVDEMDPDLIKILQEELGENSVLDTLNLLNP